MARSPRIGARFKASSQAGGARSRRTSHPPARSPSDPESETMTLVKATRIVCSVLAVLYLGAAAAIVLVALPTPRCRWHLRSRHVVGVRLGGVLQPDLHRGRSRAVGGVRATTTVAGLRRSMSVQRQHAVWRRREPSSSGRCFSPWASRGWCDASPGTTTPTTDGGAPSGWYPDPRDPGVPRWWDGTAWVPHHPPADVSSTPLSH